MIKIIGFFGLVSIIITCMGIFGQICNDTLSKTKEIGIRKINGANISEVMIMLNKSIVILIGFSFVIAVPVALFIIHSWLDNFAYKTRISWWIFVIAGLTVLAITLFTVSWQAWRAATRNPVEALRYE